VISFGVPIRPERYLDRGDERTVLLGRSTGRVDDRRGVQVKVEELP
jgi:hypothetical protein